MLEQITDFFITSAYADSTSGANPPGGGMSLLMMLTIFFLFAYFAIWRPQSKRAKEQQNLLTSLAKGDEVVTIGGILGRITRISDQYITLSLGSDKAEMIMQKSAVANILPKGTLKSIE